MGDISKGGPTHSSPPKKKRKKVSNLEGTKKTCFYGYAEKREITATTQAIRKIITIHQLSQKETLGLEVMSGLFLGGLTVSALNHPRSSLSSLTQVSSGSDSGKGCQKGTYEIIFCNMAHIY
jgi:hypothetical protein